MFLDKIILKKTTDKLIESMESDAHEIQELRISIASKISELANTGLSATDILNHLISTTNLSKSAIKNMIEEHSFSLKYQHSFHLNFFEIKTLKKIKNLHQINDSEFSDILLSKEKTLSLINEFNNAPQTANFSHSFNLNSDQNDLFLECKNIAEEQMAEKFSKKGDFIYFLLIDFYTNNSHLFDVD